MYFDVNVNCDFEDFKDLEEVECCGFCVTVQYAPSITPPNLPKINKSLYTRIDVEYSSKLDPSAIAKLRVFNVVCIVTDSSAHIQSIIKLQPDIIRITTENIRHIKKTTIRSIKDSKIFLEMKIVDGIYSSKDRICWMNACRKLITLGGSKCLVISSGAKMFTETRSSNDIFKMMNIFGLSNDKVKVILNNSELMLRSAAFKRYTLNGAVSTSKYEDNFKNDFIINYHKK